MQEKNYLVADWYGLYGEGWGEDIVPEAFSHPAKYSRALIRHIYQYLIDNKLIERGAKVLDPFGGVALGALDAQLQGLHWVGCELEPKFVALGNLNLELWRKRYAPHFSRWGSAQLVQGDSRRIGEVIAGKVGGLDTSPPYADLPTNDAQRQSRHSDNDGAMNGSDFGAVIASPPFSDTNIGVRQYGPSQIVPNSDRAWVKKWEAGEREESITSYGDNSPGQLGSMPSDDFSAIVASPPFIQTSGGATLGLNKDPNGAIDAGLLERHRASRAEAYGAEEGQLQNMREGDVEVIISSPPFVGIIASHDKKFITPGEMEKINQSKSNQFEYGEVEGQLGALPEGDVNAVISSPPYAGADIGTKDARDAQARFEQLQRAQERGDILGHESLRVLRKGISDRNSGFMASPEGYGKTDGQLGSAPEGDFDSVVSSPPYEGTEVASETDMRREARIAARAKGEWEGYNKENDANLGSTEGDSFWSASLAIVSQCYQLLAPGGVAVWVCKDYVRNKKRVPFSDQWRMLCEKVGFTTLTEVHAWVIEDNGTQLAFGEVEDKAHRKERKSFFRRLAEKKGSPRIDWETVWIMRKPVDNGAQAL